METYSVIGLMLALFGGTYTAIAALKGWTDPIIIKHAKRRNDAACELKRYTGKKHSQGIGRVYGGSLALFCALYHIAQAVPIFAFSIFSLWMTHWAMNNFSGDIPDNQIDHWKYIISVAFLISIYSLATIVGSLIFAWISGVLLDSHLKTVLEISSPEVQGVENQSEPNQ